LPVKNNIADDVAWLSKIYAPKPNGTKNNIKKSP